MRAVAVAAGGLDPNSVSPGLLGFLATFALVLVSILLFWNMNARLRRMRRREEREELQEREQHQERDENGSDGDPGPRE